MKNLTKFSALATTVLVALSFSGIAMGQAAKKGAAPAAKSQAAPPAAAPKAAAAKAAPAAGASEREIADASAKGLVWVNTDSKIYHTKEGQFYGKTKVGKFMTEADAKKAGYRAAKASPIGKKKKS